MQKNRYILLLLFIFFSSCTKKVATEVYQNKRDNVVNLHSKVKEIGTEDVLINRYSQPFLLDRYLIIGDYVSKDNLVHIFDKYDFKYICSTAFLGPGPTEITSFGSFCINENDREFYISDYGKQKIFTYELDSVLSNPLNYMPTVKVNLNQEQIPNRYYYINDSLCYASIITPTGRSGFNQSGAIWNMMTGKITQLKYTHPEIEKKRVNIAVSIKNKTFVECYDHHDLMTIYDLEGDLKCNVYGSKWNNKTSNKQNYYGSVIFAKDKIVASYSDGIDNFGKQSRPTTLLVFDLKGNYLKTLEIGYNILEFCYDEENNRIIMSFDDDIQLGYLELGNIV